MKRLLLFAFALLGALPALADPTTNAPSVTLAWDAVNDPIVNGYGLYWGVASRSYTNFIVVTPQTNTICTVSNLVRNTTYYFAATSRATNGLESDFSVEVSYHTSPLPPRPENVRATTDKP